MIKTLLPLLLLILIIGCSPKEAIHKEINLHKSTVYILHNQIRKNHNLPPFEYDGKLDQFAQTHAEKMAQTRTLKHQNIAKILPEGYFTIGENIAWNQTSEKEVVKAWMNSPEHRSNILNSKFKYMAVGIAENRGEIYWCAIFGG